MDFYGGIDLIVVNGLPLDPGGAKTLSQLVVDLKVSPSAVVIERNGIISSKDEWDDTPVKEGDQIEIIRYVGGGSRLNRSGCADYL
ncbi:MAG: sulfur carrier protein ThiS [Candidatus Margulisiibacteriota bacterium]